MPGSAASAPQVAKDKALRGSLWSAQTLRQQSCHKKERSEYAASGDHEDGAGIARLVGIASGKAAQHEAHIDGQLIGNHSVEQEKLSI